MTGPPIIWTVGQPTVEFIQCYKKGINPATGTHDFAVYNATDILTGALIPSGQTTPVFAPAMAFYGNTGYTVGQTTASPTAANMALVVPGVSYTLDVYRALATAPTNKELIAQRLVIIKPIAIS